ncbi:MAG: hypothetical protein DLM70_02925 [Chloroflexi bacterium]|nr:MAG: hypothetical protein DLM70_02925 [Chloroflexota bacterium]
MHSSAADLQNGDQAQTVDLADSANLDFGNARHRLALTWSLAGMHGIPKQYQAVEESLRQSLRLYARAATEYSAGVKGSGASPSARGRSDSSRAAGYLEQADRLLQAQPETSQQSVQERARREVARTDRPASSKKRRLVTPKTSPTRLVVAGPFATAILARVPPPAVPTPRPAIESRKSTSVANPRIRPVSARPRRLLEGDRTRLLHVLAETVQATTLLKRARSSLSQAQASQDPRQAAVAVVDIGVARDRTALAKNLLSRVRGSGVRSRAVASIRRAIGHDEVVAGRLLSASNEVIGADPQGAAVSLADSDANILKASDSLAAARSALAERH